MKLRPLATLLMLSALAACAAPGSAESGNAVPDPRAEEPERDAASSELAAAGSFTPGASGFRPSTFGDGGANPVLARFKDREIRASDLGSYLLKTRRQEAVAALGKMIGIEIVGAEAERIGIEVPPAWLVGRREAMVERLEREAAIAYGVGATPERFVTLQFRQSLEDYLATRLEEEGERYLISRVIRYQARVTDRLELDVIVMKDADGARTVAAKLDQGADFGRLAKAHSLHESGRRSGRLPPLPAEALHPVVAERASKLRPGQRTGVLRLTEGPGQQRYQIVRLRSRIEGEPVTWDEVRGDIEAGLAERPIDADEYTAWYLRLERKYGVEVSDDL